MFLLNSATTSLPQFASLSLVLNTDTENVEQTVQMVSPILCLSPLCYISQTQILDALGELHFHLNCTIKAATDNTTNDIAMSFFKEDARQMEDVQLFTPLAGSGIGLYYRLIRTDPKTNVMAKLAQTVLVANKTTGVPAATLTDTSGIWGFLLCVGFTGLPLLTMQSDLFYHLSERVSDTKEILTKRSELDANTVKTLISTLLLYEDDSRMSNARILTTRLSHIPEPENEGTGEKVKTSIMSPLSIRKKKDEVKSNALDGDGEAPEREDSYLHLEHNGMSGGEETRLLSERIKVMSVAEPKTLLQKYSHSAFERRANLDLKSSGRFSSRKRSSARDADLDSFDYKGPTRGGPNAAASKSNLAPLVGGALLPSASSSSLSHHGGSVAGSTAGGSGGGSSSHHHQTKGLALKQPSKDTKVKGMLNAPRNDGGGRRGRGGGADDSAAASSNSFDPFGKTTASSSRGYDDDIVASSGNAGATTQHRLQVNVALNEDLSCSYRSSQISSCSVEGVVQVQVRASTSGAQNQAPFLLYLRDASEQVESFQENRKHADDVSHTLLDEDDADRKYMINVPNGESYFPVVRYKCVEELRPVPIRVQTRAKIENGQCRVALQISSNPNNEAKLTDLTIIMGVPEDIQGDTLITQPAGGVWNESKRCVTWCVEELAEGEKFQLQARFHLAPNAKYEQTGEKPLFPVLVRCQCLFAQLSDLELEIRDIPEIFPADVTMKIARRFRLSHRERS